MPLALAVLRKRQELMIRVLLGFVAIAAFLWAVLTFVPGYVASDEVAYDWAARAFHNGRGLDLGNRYAELASVELGQPNANSIAPAQGRLVSKYPSGFPLIASLLYGGFGLSALAYLNAAALALGLVLTWLLARTLLRSEGLALVAVLLLSCATFTPQYGRALWPHAFTLSLLLGALVLVARSPQNERARRRMLGLGLAGLIAGLALNARVDALLFIAALGLALLLTRPFSLRAPLAFSAGILPGLLLLSLDNYYKWGSFYPFAYSSDVGSEVRFSMQFLPVSCLGLASVALAHIWPWARARLRATRRRWLIASLCLATLAAMGYLPVRSAALSWTQGTYALLFDLSSAGIELGGAVNRERTELGSFVYSGGFKTGLLQSCPFLLLGVLPFLLSKHHRTSLPWLAVLVPMLFLPLGFGWSSWQGGGANLRYFLPVMPLGCIAAVEGLRLVRPLRSSSLVGGLAIASAGLAVVLWWWLLDQHPLSRIVELIRTPASTGLALSTLMFVLVRGLGTRRLRRFARLPLMVISALALAWAGAGAARYDLMLAQSQRITVASVSELIRANFPPNSLLLLDVPAPTPPEMVVAYPVVDHAKDSWRLIEHFRSEGKRVFGIMAEAGWEALMKRPEARGGVLRLSTSNGVAVGEVLPDGRPLHGAPSRSAQ